MMKQAKEFDSTLFQILMSMVEMNEDPELTEVVKNIPAEVLQLFSDPRQYTGAAERKTETIINAAKNWLVNEI